MPSTPQASPTAVQSPALSFSSQNAPHPPSQGTKLTFEDFWQHSKIVHEEVEKLERRVQEVQQQFDHSKVDPLPEGLPLGAMALGEPIASMKVLERGPWKIMLGICLALALICWLSTLAFIPALREVVGANSKLSKNERAVGIGCPIFGFACLFIGLLPLLPRRTNSANCNFWICQHGIIWSGRNKIGFARWEDITEAYEDLKSEMQTKKEFGVTRRVVVRYNVFRIKLAGEIITFTFRFEFPHYILCKAASVFFRTALKRIFAGETVSFGGFDIDRHGLRWENETYEWPEMKGAELASEGEQGYYLDLEVKTSRKPVTINAHDVSLAPAALAVCHVLIEERTAFPAQPVQKKPEQNPFAF